LGGIPIYTRRFILLSIYIIRKRRKQQRIVVLAPLPTIRSFDTMNGLTPLLASWLIVLMVTNGITSRPLFLELALDTPTGRRGIKILMIVTST
jgi:hypothetical protein